MSKAKNVKDEQEKTNAAENTVVENTLAENASVENTSVEVLSGEVIFTPFSMDDEQKYYALCTALETDVDQLEDRHISIACKLAEISDKELYKVGNYHNIYSFAKEKFALSHTYCHNHIQIAKKFCQYDKQSHTYIGLLPEYKDFTISQLACILPVPIPLLGKFNADMTITE